MRVLGALLLAAVVAGLSVALLTLNPITAFFSVPLALATAFVLGYPAYLLLRKVGWLTLPICALTGVLLAMPTVAFLPMGWILGALAASGGAIGGVVFWWAALADDCPSSYGHT